MYEKNLILQNIRNNLDNIPYYIYNSYNYDEEYIFCTHKNGDNKLLFKTLSSYEIIVLFKPRDCLKYIQENSNSILN